MNERIKELADQALKECDDAKERGIEQYSKRLAELIVRECAGVCEEYRGTEWGKAAECIGDSIKEHFEVEE